MMNKSYCSECGKQMFRKPTKKHGLSFCDGSCVYDFDNWLSFVSEFTVIWRNLDVFKKSPLVMNDFELESDWKTLTGRRYIVRGQVAFKLETLLNKIIGKGGEI